jgi:hypothetical protein
MISEKTLIGEVQGTLLTPARTTGLGVVVLTGSSGRVDSRRASLFAANGAVAPAPTPTAARAVLLRGPFRYYADRGVLAVGDRNAFAALKPSDVQRSSV